ncbi:MULTISPECIES: metallophosphoesterase [Aneurinibacillus]|uniref:Calcineurin-like phosphoesterase domain-containing protein n=1 Tax=Aneurinibacillus danicus TaxID=267746 RepID=A0A511V407_9BACL|nr:MULTISPECIES: metallophosphoesterase [Aneurinibacillus]GEN33644.1 hypothetical protein ADA01nite_11040 [Aneurinibacillus danicus]
MRTLCISDIHGHYDAFCRLLERVSYNPASDRLVLMGDFIDGGAGHNRQLNCLAITEHGYETYSVSISS